MSPKIKEISLAKREQIIYLRNSGKTFREISSELNVSLCAIYNILKKKNQTGVVDNKQRSGRPKKLTEREPRKMTSG